MPYLHCLLLIDLRSRKLLEMTKPGLIKCEEDLSAEAQVFTLDRNRSKLATYATSALETLREIGADVTLENAYQPVARSRRPGRSDERPRLGPSDDPSTRVG